MCTIRVPHTQLKPWWYNFKNTQKFKLHTCTWKLEKVHHKSYLSAVHTQVPLYTTLLYILVHWDWDVNDNDNNFHAWNADHSKSTEDQIDKMLSWTNDMHHSRVWVLRHTHTPHWFTVRAVHNKQFTVVSKACAEPPKHAPSPRPSHRATSQELASWLSATNTYRFAHR